MTDRNDTADLLMLHGVVADCPDCLGPRVMLPTDHPGELCCTGCDAAVFALGGQGSVAPAVLADAS
jgi:hypothetical protein